MVRGVNEATEKRRAERVADTEGRLIAAATRLFARDGYAATSLARVAAEAGVAERTVYVRFGTKAELLKRVIDVALVGDTAPVDVAGREWTQRSLSAPTLAERIAVRAAGAAEMLDRAGPVLAVGFQAEGSEPVVAAAAQAGREATLENHRRFWAAAVADGLLPADADVEWLTETSGLLGSAQTYLLSRQILPWDRSAYEKWMVTTWTRLASVAGLRACSGSCTTTR